MVPPLGACAVKFTVGGKEYEVSPGVEGLQLNDPTMLKVDTMEEEAEEAPGSLSTEMMQQLGLSSEPVANATTRQSDDEPKRPRFRARYCRRIAQLVQVGDSAIPGTRRALTPALLQSGAYSSLEPLRVPLQSDDHFY